jgi:hypothetical protein
MAWDFGIGLSEQLRRPDFLVTIRNQLRHFHPIHSLGEFRGGCGLLTGDEKLICHGDNFCERIFPRSNTNQEITLRTRHGYVAGGNQFLTLVKQPQGVHSRFDVIAELLFDFWTLSFLSAALTTGHTLELIVGKAHKLLCTTARQEYIFVLSNDGPDRVLDRILGHRKCSAVGFPLQASPAHFFSE